MIPSHNAAVNAALLAIASAFLAGKPGQGKWTHESVDLRAGYILRELINKQALESLAAEIEDRAEDVSLPVGVVVRLMLDAMKVPWLEQDHASLLGYEKQVRERFRSVRRIMKDRTLGHDRRMRKALFELGVIGEDGGAGADRVDHRHIANHYFALRTGGSLWEGKKLAPHSHDAAVQVIETRYGIPWDSLQRAWRRKRIEVRTEAVVFPIK
jgi:hypothetical protein